MNHINIQYFKHPYAEFVLGSYNNSLCLCDFRYRKQRSAVDHRIQQGLQANFIEKNDDVLECARSQLEQYFLGERRLFDIPLLMVGTAFQKSVWHTLMKVKYGEMASYHALAKGIGNENATRAVANANGANGIAIMVPCHRIIGSNGQLVGFGGGLPLKQRLLALEHSLFS